MRMPRPIPHRASATRSTLPVRVQRRPPLLVTPGGGFRRIPRIPAKGIAEMTNPETTSVSGYDL